MANFQYAAPEQKQREGKVDQRADIFALGLILNELFTGEIPAGTGYRTINDVDPEHGYLDELVSRMIAQSPESRPGSISEVKRIAKALGLENSVSQKLDKQQKVVIPETEIVDPIPQSGTQVVGVDWDNGTLVIQLNHSPGPVWQQAFYNMGSHTSVMGKGPERFSFRHYKDYEVEVSVSDTQARRVLDYFKSWLPQVDGVCRRMLKDIAVAESRRIQKIHDDAIAEQQRRKKVLEELNE